MKSKKLVALMSSVFLLSSLIVTTPTKAEILKDRIYGHNRYETSSEVSRSDFIKSKNVVLASGANFADALCAAPLAKKLDAPILLTEKDVISKSTLKEIERLDAKEVVIIGGEGVISNKVKKTLEDKKLKVDRVYGKNRYETSMEIAKRLDSPASIAITTGTGFADSLSMAPIAANKNMPIVLCDGNNLSKEIKEYLKQKEIKNSYVLGGEGVVSKAIEKDLPSPKRLSGNNRYETNLAVLKEFDKELNFKKVYVTLASGEKDFADGLSISAVAAKELSPVVLVGNTVLNDTKSYIRDNTKNDSKIIALGSEKILAQKLINSLSCDAQIQEVDNSIKDSIKFIKAKKEKTYDDAIALRMAKESVDENSKKQLENYFEQSASKADLAKCSKSVLTALALKENPENFVGVNWIEKTSKLLKESEGFVNQKIWGPIALEAAGVDYDKDSAFEYIKKEQKKDGGFSWIEGTDESDAWPDMTAMAIYSMTMMGKTSYDKEVARALERLKVYLKDMEKHEKTQSVESLAQIAMAVISAKDDIKNYKINGNNIIDEILTYQTPNGGFKHQKTDGGPNGMSTNQSLQALLFYKNGRNLFESLNNYGNFKLIISNNNGKEEILNKNLSIKEGKTSLDYLKQEANVKLNGTFITGINDLNGIYWKDLTDDEKINDISGKDWFIYINGKKASVGASDILPKNGETITFDYHAYDWKEFAAPGEKEMPIVLNTPKNIEKGKETEFKTLCGWTPLVKAKITIDGKTYETDMEGKVKIVLDKAQKYTVKVEKSGYSKTFEVQAKESTKSINESLNSNLQKAA